MAQLLSSDTSSAALPTSSPRVLIVDDVKSTRDRLMRLLGTGGYEVLEALDGRDALKMLAMTSRIDAILLDLVMPSMNGWEFREVQLRDARLCDIPTLVLTVKDLAEHERYALRIPTTTLIRKPFEDWQILDGLSRVLRDVPPAAAAPESRWLTPDGSPLLWSRDGCVACESHAPTRDSSEWMARGWAWIPAFAGKNRIQYACQQCTGGPIRHRRHVPDEG